MLNLGREIQLPFHRNIELESDSFNSRSTYKNDLIAKLHSIYEKAISNINKSQAMQAKHYNARHSQVVFKVGDWVLVKTHYLSDKSRKFMKKFAARWTGPYPVIKICTPVSYELDIPNSNFKVHNVKNLKLYHDRPSSNDNFQTDSNHVQVESALIEEDLSSSLVVTRDLLKLNNTISALGENKIVSF